MKKLVSLIMSLVVILNLGTISFASTEALSKKSNALKWEKDFSWEKYQDKLDQIPDFDVITSQELNTVEGSEKTNSKTLLNGSDNNTIILKTKGITTKIKHKETAKEDILYFNEIETGKADKISINKKTGVMKYNDEAIIIKKESIDSLNSETLSTRSSWTYIGQSRSTLQFSNYLQDLTIAALASAIVALLGGGVFLTVAAAVLSPIPSNYLRSSAVYTIEDSWLESDAIYPQLKTRVKIYYDPDRDDFAGSETNIIF